MTESPVTRLVNSFLELREELWPGSNTYPQARTPLNLQAQQLLDTFKSYKPEFIEQEMRAHLRWRAEQGFARPFSLLVCQNALRNASARARVNKKADPAEKVMAQANGQHALWLKRLQWWQKDGFWQPMWGEKPPHTNHPDARRAMKEMGIT